jgi:hypothetical protein
MIFKICHKIERESTPPNSFYKTSIVLIPKLDKGTTKEENSRPVSLMHIDGKFSVKYWQTEFKSILKDHMP